MENIASGLSTGAQTKNKAKTIQQPVSKSHYFRIFQNWFRLFRLVLSWSAAAFGSVQVNFSFPSSHVFRLAIGRPTSISFLLIFHAIAKWLQHLKWPQVCVRVCVCKCSAFRLRTKSITFSRSVEIRNEQQQQKIIQKTNRTSFRLCIA